jgi:phospholipase/lecithinase/hemolysin
MVFNSALRVKVQELHATLKANIEIFEAFDYVAEMKYNPESYGFTNTTDLCIDDPICSVDPTVAQGYMLWDAPHKTTRVHEILGARLSDQARQMSYKKKKHIR